MKVEDMSPAGSININPLEDVVEKPAAVTPDPEKKTEEAPVKQDKPEAGEDRMTKLEKMFEESQKMIGKQSNEIGKLRGELQTNAPKTEEKQKGPSEQDQIKTILKAVDDGEMDMQEGMMKALELNTNLTTAQVMTKFGKMKEEEEVGKATQDFHTKNPDYKSLVESGALDQYLQDDPMADEYVAYKSYKADEKVRTLTEEYEAKIAAAKTEGARLADGSKGAADVLGKSGAAARDTATAPKQFQTKQEATDAMMATLAGMRSGA
jgi:hypothetical protein